MATIDEMITVLQSRFQADAFAARPLLEKAPCGQFFIRVEPGRSLEIMQYLRDDPRLLFEQLCDLTCVDYLHFPNAADRYGVIYSLLSLTHGHRLWVKCFVNDPKPAVPSVTSIWKGAEWMEREVFDMFGIVFEGHPDLRRILTWDEFKAHPLRKDYPLRGLGEREDYQVVERDSA
jgi:NADH-quinone oxidoreductase subunit C